VWSLSVFIFVILIAAVVIYIRSNLRAREWAIFHARNICKQYNVQLLDDSIVQTKLKMTRLASTGSLGWQRDYCFDYSSNGVGRESGIVKLHGNQLAHISIYEQDSTESRPSEQVDEPPTSRPANDNVVSISSFRNKDQD
jgi:hypothetical protein